MHNIRVFGFSIIFTIHFWGETPYYWKQKTAPTFQRQETGVKTTLKTEVKNLYISSIEMKPGDPTQPKNQKKQRVVWRNPGFKSQVHSKWISKLDSRWTKEKNMTLINFLRKLLVGKNHGVLHVFCCLTQKKNWVPMRGY